MTDTDASLRIKSLLESYKLLLCRQGLALLTTNKEKVDIYQVLSAIRPDSLQARLQSDLEMSLYDLQKDFKGFMTHLIRLSEVFQLVENNSPANSARTGKTPRAGHLHDKDDNGGYNNGRKVITQHLARTLNASQFVFSAYIRQRVSATF